MFSYGFLVIGRGIVESIGEMRRAHKAQTEVAQIKGSSLVMPSPDLLAADMFSCGMRSCLDAEVKGWSVSQHKGLRAAVDERLAKLWAEAK